jgi:hypothetical protein
MTLVLPVTTDAVTAHSAVLRTALTLMVAIKCFLNETDVMK